MPGSRWLYSFHRNTNEDHLENQAAMTPAIVGLTASTKSAAKASKANAAAIPNNTNTFP